MKKTLTLAGEIQISVQTNAAEDTALTCLEPVSEKNISGTPGVFVVAYRVDPQASTAVALPEIEILVELPLFGVVRLMPPSDFGACSRVGMWYDNSWGTHAVGYEPFVLFVGAGGECKCLVGLARLECSTAIRAHVYGGPSEAVISGVKGIGAVHIKRNSAAHGHFKGTGARVFEDAIYVDMAGGDTHDAVRRYFTWLRNSYYQRSPAIPDGADEVMWHSWYALQAVINQDIIREQARLARKLDIRRIQIDAFWDVPTTSSSVWGGNRADSGRFPDFRGLIMELHEAGQRVALHTNPFVINPFHFNDQRHLMPFLLSRNGKPFKGGYESYLLCPRCPQTRDYILSCAQRIVGEYGVDEIWYDFVDNFAELYGECDRCAHEHLSGTPGEHVVAILGAMAEEARRINPAACLWGRRQQSNPITRQWESTLMPHDRYLDYPGNLRECLFLRQLAHRQLVQFVPTNWPVGGEDPAVVARHMISGIFAGVPGISVDLTRQSPEVLEVIRTYVALYRRNKAWLNASSRRLLCPEDAIRCVAVDGPDCCWILCTGTAPGMLAVPRDIREVRVFSAALGDMAFLLNVRGAWRAVQHDYLLREVANVPLQTLTDGLFVRIKGTPLFSAHLQRV